MTEWKSGKFTTPILRYLDATYSATQFYDEAQERMKFSGDGMGKKARSQDRTVLSTW